MEREGERNGEGEGEGADQRECRKWMQYIYIMCVRTQIFCICMMIVAACVFGSILGELQAWYNMTWYNII
jgi:hypothetical protein